MIICTIINSYQLYIIDYFKWQILIYVNYKNSITMYCLQNIWVTIGVNLFNIIQ